MIRPILSFIIKRYLLSERIILLNKKIKLYSEVISDEDIYSYQLNKFNELWKRAVSDFEFYKQWKRKHNLPDRITSIAELKEFPPLTKDIINKNQNLILDDLDDYYLTSTGGTSGVTTHFPTSKEDADETYVNAYLGRSWWGIKPLDNILMFWGHSHLFGKGLKRYYKEIKRKLSDYLIHTKRISCYNLDVGNVKSFYTSLLKSDPITVISYASNLFKLCKYMETNDLEYTSSTLHGIILTSETVTKADQDLIEKLFHTQVINEFGMAETGAAAYSYKNTNNIRVFWDSFIFTVNNESELFITTITDKKFPLINYSTEDKVVVKNDCNDSVLYLSSIDGKVRNILNVSMVDGKVREISTIFFDHVLKYYPEIYSLHYCQDENVVIINFTASSQLNIDEVNMYMIKEINKEFQGIDFSKIQLKQIDKAIKTIAGKNTTVIKS